MTVQNIYAASSLQIPMLKKALKLSFPPIVDVEPWLTSKSG